MAPQIGRLLTAMVTPFDSEGRVDYPQARKLALALSRPAATASSSQAPPASRPR